MKATVVNLNSTFDWRKDVAAILVPLDGTSIASALGVPDAADAINDRLSRLRWIFLISDLTLEAQVRANPHGEGSEPERPQREFPFCQRRGGRQGESRFYRQPRSASGGGVVEPLGIYTRDVRAFAGQAPLKPFSTRSVEQSSEGPTLESLLPDEANGPAVILCPERLFELPYELVRSLERQEPHPASQLNLSDLFLRMTLIHEIGHHVLPVPVSERAGASRHIHVSEALANTFCNALLAPEERQWLFAKAWLLQPTAYLGYFVPHILEKLEPSAQFADEWKDVVRNSLGMTPDDHDRCHFDEIPSFRSKPFVGSPQMHWATSGLLQALSLIPPEPFLPDCEPCAIGPFEEFDMPWATEPGLLRLLQHPERSVQTEAFRSLVRADDRQPETGQALARWCDAHIGSDYLQEAEVAWNSPFAHRDEGRLDRYRKVAASPHEIIVADLPEKARRHCSKEDGRPIIECLLDDSRLEVRLAAVRELAGLFYDADDVVDLEKFVLNRPHREVTRAKAAELPVDLMFLLAVWEHPLRDNIVWSAPFLCDLATKQVEALQGNEATARKERVASEARKLLLGNRVAWGGLSAVAMVFSKAAKCDDMRSLLPKLVECGFGALQPDQGSLETCKINADPSFFMEKGYTESESLFATFHELEHFLDMTRGEAAYRVLWKHLDENGKRVGKGYGKALHRMFNCIDDVLVNKSVMAKWKDGVKARNSLYPKLFPNADLRMLGGGNPRPRHKQFAYALLRNAMFPHKASIVDAEVQEALDALATNIGISREALLQKITDVDMDGVGVFATNIRYGAMLNHFQPVFEKFFLQDLVDRKQKKQEKGEGEKGEGEGGDEGDEGGEGDDGDEGDEDENGNPTKKKGKPEKPDDENDDPDDNPFGDDPLDDAIPDPIDDKKVNDILKGLKKAQRKQRW